MAKNVKIYSVRGKQGNVSYVRVLCIHKSGLKKESLYKSLYMFPVNKEAWELNKTPLVVKVWYMLDPLWCSPHFSSLFNFAIFPQWSLKTWLKVIGWRHGHLPKLRTESFLTSNAGHAKRLCWLVRITRPKSCNMWPQKFKNIWTDSIGRCRHLSLTGWWLILFLCWVSSIYVWSSDRDACLPILGRCTIHDTLE